jgi:uncharacterized RDD family membrane protein YckC
MSDGDTYYEELGATPNASRDELKAAYQARLSELEAAREGKGVTESQLQRNRDEVARVRTAWNVLADPFQRARYDEQLGAASANGEVSEGDADGGDGDEVTGERPDVQLTGWRRLMAPPPKPKPAAGGGPPPPRRPLREPTMELPRGMRFAEPRARGMALLFDVAVLLVILYAVQFVAPGLIQSDYRDKVDQISHLNDLEDAQDSVDDATSSVQSADRAIAKAEAANNSGDLKSAQSDKKSAQEDLKSAQSDFDEAAKDVEKDGLPVLHDSDKIQKQIDTASDDIRGTQYAIALITLVLALLYLVPLTAITGRTLGMRGRKIRVARVDGSPVGWYGAFTRFLVPILIALAIPTLGPLLGLGMVLWAFRDPNGQGLHDKLARTIVVADPT